MILSNWHILTLSGFVQVYLAFYMAMQLASFFTLAGTALWMNRLGEHLNDKMMPMYRIFIGLFIAGIVVRPSGSYL